MMTNEWIDRYIYAVTRRLPAGERGDIAQELRTLIGDMLEERCGDLAPSEQDVRLVLTQLGSPAQLSRQYDPEGGKSLIGPGYYGKYKMVLRLVLASVGFGLAVANILLVLLGERTPAQALQQGLGMIVTGLLWGFGLITLGFAILERRGIPFNDSFDSIDTLPPVPQAGADVSRGQATAAIVLDVAALIVFLFVPQMIAIPTENGLFPVLDLDFIRLHWFWPVLFFATGITRDVCLMNTGRFTPKLARLTLALDAAAAVGSLFFWGSGAILNPQLPIVLEQIFPGEAVIAHLIGHANLLMLGVILFALVLDCIKAFVKSATPRQEK